MDALSRTRTVGEVIAAMAVEMGNAGGVPAPAAVPAPVGRRESIARVKAMMQSGNGVSNALATGVSGGRDCHRNGGSCGQDRYDADMIEETWSLRLSLVLIPSSA